MISTVVTIKRGIAVYGVDFWHLLRLRVLN